MNTIENTTGPVQSHFVKVSLIVAIVIVLNLFFNYAVSFVYNEPSYDQFIKPVQVVDQITTKDSCLAIGGQWTESNGVEQIPTKTNPKISGYCDPNYTNQKNYDAARKVYDRNVFITLVVLGIASILAGVFVTLSVLAISLSWGGVLSLVIASMRYWNSADKLFKVIILALALCTLIWVAVKKFSK
jgi:hypothetical protein